jgi:hypothetical protein
MEVIPAISMALFAGHFVDQRKKGLLKMYLRFSIIVWAVFIYMASFYKRFYYPNYFIFHLLFVFLGGLVRAFLGPTIFSFGLDCS